MIIDPDEDPEQTLMKSMGITGFNTTKASILSFFIYFNLCNGF